MTLPEILAEIDAALAAAREAGPITDRDAQAIRAEIIQSHRKATTGQSYEHEWVPPRQLPPEPDEPEQQPLNFAPRPQRRNDRF